MDYNNIISFRKNTPEYKALDFISLGKKTAGGHAFTAEILVRRNFDKEGTVDLYCTDGSILKYISQVKIHQLKTETAYNVVKHTKSEIQLRLSSCPADKFPDFSIFIDKDKRQGELVSYEYNQRLSYSGTNHNYLNYYLVKYFDTCIDYEYLKHVIGDDSRNQCKWTVSGSDNKSAMYFEGSNRLIVIMPLGALNQNSSFEKIIEAQETTAQAV